MMYITSYFKPSYNYEYLKSKIRNLTEKAGIKVEFEEVTDVNEFLNENLTSIPAFKIDDQIVVKSKGQDLKSFALELEYRILKKRNFGKLQKIIVPTDFSETSKNAIRYANELNKNLKGVIQLMHIFNPKVKKLDGVLSVDPLESKNKMDELESLADEMRNSKFNQPGAIVDTIFESGFPADKILQLINSIENSLLVMGNTGASGWMKKFFGSVSTKIAQESKIPSLFVPDGCKFRPYKNIVYCTSDLQLDAVVFTQVIDFALNFDTTIHLVHIHNDDNYDERAVLRMWEHFYPKGKLNYAQLKASDTNNVLQEYVEEQEIDLVALSNKNRSLFSRFFKRSFTKEVTKSAQVPTLILHN